MGPLVHSIYLLALALWVGGAALFTLGLTPALFATLGAPRAGEVVGVLFPVYFPYLVGAALVALLALALGGGGTRPRPRRRALVLLAIAVALGLTQLLVLHPRARSLKAVLRDAPGSTGARQEFRRVHATSSALNLVVLLDGVFLLCTAAGLAAPRAAPRQNR